MVGIVVGDQKRFAKQSLAVSMGDLGSKVTFGVRNQGRHGFQISQYLLYARVPGFFIWRSLRLGPVLIWPFGRFMLTGAAEFKNVPLGNADMLQQLPRRVRSALGFAAAKFAGKILERLAQIDVRFCFCK